jgi:hypothetical protein
MLKIGAGEFVDGGSAMLMDGVSVGDRVIILSLGDGVLTDGTLDIMEAIVSDGDGVSD